MKIRTDFVTNSSSSSFIFGKPNSISGMTKESLLSNIENFCQRVVQVREKIDSTLKQKNPNLYEKLITCREMYSRQLSDSEFNTYYNLKRSLNKSKALEKIINKQLKTLQDVIPNTEDIYLDFLYSDRVYEKIKSNLSSINLSKHIYDFKEPNTEYNESLDGVIYWYTDVEGYTVTKLKDIIDDTDNKYGLTQAERDYIQDNIKNTEGVIIDYNSIVYKTIGELGIYGYESGDIPDIIVSYLDNLSTVCCNHMG